VRHGSRSAVQVTLFDFLSIAGNDPIAGVVRIPKLGRVRLRHSRQALGRLKNVTIRLDRSRWIASLLTEREVDVPQSAATGEVGLDFGIKTSIMPSSGEPITLPVRIFRYERRLRHLQRAASRKQKNSNNRRKAAARIAECHRRITAIRLDFLHKETTILVRNNALIAIEDLRVKNMTMSAAGTVNSPGKNVRQKSGLNRAILRNAWSMSRKMLEYKAAWAGAILVAVPAAHSSQECSECHHVAADNRPSQALFRCVACGHEAHADRNAAKIILRRARQSLTGECPSSTAGIAGFHACEGSASRYPRPRSAAQGRVVQLPLAGTTSELSPFDDPLVAHTACAGKDDKCFWTGTTATN
jgi:putative transposase